MWRTWLAVAFVAVQLLLPLQYYCGRQDKHDERFAWRMFSPMRMTTCNPVFTRNGQPIVLGNRYHEAWGTLAKRGRQVVLDAMAKDLCQPGADVRLTMTCSYLNATERVTAGDRNLCEAAR